MLIDNYIVARQGDFLMYSLVLSVDELVNNTYVDFFSSEDPDNDGYQRPLIPNHYRKFAKYLQSGNPILASSILTAADNEQLNLNGKSLQINGRLRIVDGQHRIAGFRYLRDHDIYSYNRIKYYEIPVTIMVISPQTKIHEINTFIDINSKGKRVSTDLAIRLREKIRNHGQGFYDNKNEVIEQVATDITIILNSTKNSVWFDAIKIGPDQNGRIISINAFNKSLSDLISFYWEKGYLSNQKDVNFYTDYLCELLIECWEIIQSRWPSCFKLYNTPRFNSDYNIQKGIGVNSLHIVLTKIIRDHDKKSQKEILYEFESIIRSTKVSDSDWITGGRFMGYNSKAGFNKIAEYILTGQET